MIDLMKYTAGSETEFKTMLMIENSMSVTSSDACTTYRKIEKAKNPIDVKYYC